jgi:hypothetical protein
MKFQVHAAPDSGENANHAGAGFARPQQGQDQPCASDWAIRSSKNR